MPPNIWGKNGYMMGEMYYVYKNNLGRTWEDFTIFQPTKNQWKRSERKLMYEGGIPMLSEIKACPHIEYEADLIGIQVQ